MKLCETKPEIEYPCQWNFKVIGMVREKIENAISDCVSLPGKKISFSNVSKGGKYCSVNLEVTVADEQERNAIYISLKNHPDVKIVM